MEAIPMTKKHFLLANVLSLLFLLFAGFFSSSKIAYALAGNPAQLLEEGTGNGLGASPFGDGLPDSTVNFPQAGSANGGTILPPSSSSGSFVPSTVTPVGPILPDQQNTTIYARPDNSNSGGTNDCDPDEQNAPCLILTLAQQENTDSALWEQMCVTDTQLNPVPNVSLVWRVTTDRSDKIVGAGRSNTGVDGCVQDSIPVETIELALTLADARLIFRAQAQIHPELNAIDKIELPWCSGVTAQMPSFATRITCLPYLARLQINYGTNVVGTCSGFLIADHKRSGAFKVVTNTHCVTSQTFGGNTLTVTNIEVIPGAVTLPGNPPLLSRPFGTCTVTTQDIHIPQNYLQDQDNLMPSSLGGFTDYVYDYAVLTGCRFPNLDSAQAYTLAIPPRWKGMEEVYTLGYGSSGFLQYGAAPSAWMCKLPNGNRYVVTVRAGEAGRSGSPLFAGTIRDDNKNVIGIHLSGADRCSYAISVTDELIRFAEDA